MCISIVVLLAENRDLRRVFSLGFRVSVYNTQGHVFGQQFWPVRQGGKHTIWGRMLSSKVNISLNIQFYENLQSSNVEDNMFF